MFKRNYIVILIKTSVYLSTYKHREHFNREGDLKEIILHI